MASCFLYLQVTLDSQSLKKPGFVAGFIAGSIASSGSAFGNIAYGAAKGELPAAVSSGFLGALVGGFLAGGVVLLLRKALAGLPRSLDGIRSILLLPLLGVGLTGFLMFLINYSNGCYQYWS